MATADNPRRSPIKQRILLRWVQNGFCPRKFKGGIQLDLALKEVGLLTNLRATIQGNTWRQYKFFGLVLHSRRVRLRRRSIQDQSASGTSLASQFFVLPPICIVQWEILRWLGCPSFVAYANPSLSPNCLSTFSTSLPSHSMHHLLLPLAILLFTKS